METETKKSRVAIALLIPILALGVMVLVFAGNRGNFTGLFGTAASAQSITPVPILRTAKPSFFKLDGIDGESKDESHESWIDILAFSQGQYVPAASLDTGSSRRESCVFEEISIEKNLDKASPKLAEAVCTGKVFPKLEIHLTATYGGSRTTYFAYELTNVMVTSYHIDNSKEDSDPVENVSMNFEKIKVTYTEYDDTGSSKGSVEYSWDISANKSL